MIIGDSMVKLKYNDTFINVDDSPLEENEMDVAIKYEDDLDDTMKINVINENDLLEDTNLDIFGDEEDE